MCTMCVPDALSSQKGALDFVELQLQMIDDCHVDAGNHTQVF